MKFIHCSIETAIRYPEYNPVIKKQMATMDAEELKTIEEQFKEMTAEAIEDPHYNPLVDLSQVEHFHREQAGMGSKIVIICFHFKNGGRAKWLYNHMEDFEKDYTALCGLCSPAEALQPDEDDGYKF